jgi:hypothetical protein
MVKKAAHYRGGIALFEVLHRLKPADRSNWGQALRIASRQRKFLAVLFGGDPSTAYHHRNES